jgi:hypothetical protein
VPRKPTINIPINDVLAVRAAANYDVRGSGINGLLYGLLSPTPATPGYIFGFVQSPGGNLSKAAFGQLTSIISLRR